MSSQQVRSCPVRVLLYLRCLTIHLVRDCTHLNSQLLGSAVGIQSFTAPIDLWLRMGMPHKAVALIS